MDFASFNYKHGYMEAVVRGLRRSFLRPEEYATIGVQCTKVSDLESFLRETYWGPVMQDSDAKPYSVPLLSLRLRERLAQEFHYFYENCSSPLKEFLELLFRERMIDNVVNMIQGVINKKSYAELVARLDPLGHFDGLSQLAKVQHDDLGGAFFSTVLRESPIGVYFEAYLTACRQEPSQMTNFESIGTFLVEGDIEVLRAVLKRAWLEDLRDFSEQVGGNTWEMMEPLLNTEADLRALSVVLNAPSNATQRERVEACEREHMFASFGKFYPQGVRAFCGQRNDQALRVALAPYKELSELYERGLAIAQPHLAEPTMVMELQAQSNKLGSVEDLLFAARVKACETAFTSQMHFAVFYAYMILKEQEIRNLLWIADMIILNQQQEIQNILPIFPNASAPSTKKD